ncbi:unnamed protein product [Zymoseptoria tritici ST99CH_3D1]|nr:unnamed protein product [Zymoseptoria tritici ST99CH_3D1]
MSGPYDQGYGQQTYNNQSYGYDPNYPPQGQGYQQGYQQQGGYQQQQPQYGQAQYGQPQYSQPQGYGAPPAPDYTGGQSGGYNPGAPPQHGGFQHNQQQQGYGGATQYGAQQHGPYAQQQQNTYGAPPAGSDPNNPYGYQKDPADPNHPQEGERGFMGAVAGGIGGHLLGKQAGHGILGTLAGAFLGSKGEDKFKQSHHNKHSNQRW